MSHYLVFGLASIIALAIPGPDFLLVFQTSLSKGKLAGVYSAVGISLGLCVHGLAATVGLSALMLKSAQAFEVVKWAGAAYLVYLAVVLLKDIFSKDRDSQEILMNAQLSDMSPRRYILRGFLTNVLNIKAVMFFVAIVPQFIVPGSSTTIQLLIFSLIQVMAALLWFSLVALAVNKIGVFLRRKVVKRWLDSATAAIFIALAAKLASTHRN